MTKQKRITKKQHIAAAAAAAEKLADAFRLLLWHSFKAGDRRRKPGTTELATVNFKDKIFPYTLIGLNLRTGVTHVQLGKRKEMLRFMKLSPATRLPKDFDVRGRK